MQGVGLQRDSVRLATSAEKPKDGKLKAAEERKKNKTNVKDITENVEPAMTKSRNINKAA